ncbi:PrsW family intramembrane metalloprotease [Streptomyces sp. NBC_00207]|uniref:PrsW family intramembrane metalloprotease n=1 Tax=Streptomyces sp. NBC_00207 TaxID=2903635 RepID=UPI00288478AA|nr:PrsW family intramembrane metalloprotease [Streptomyces sp. DSM 41633]
MTEGRPVGVLTGPGRQPAALLVVLSLHAAVALGMVLKLVLPRRIEVPPEMEALDELVSAVQSLPYWIYLPCWLLTAVLAAVARLHLWCARDPAGLPSGVARRYRRALVVMLLLPFAVLSLPVIPLLAWPGAWAATVLLCLPTTAYALTLVHCAQRFRRIPVPLLLAAFGWGAVIAAGFGGTMNDWWSGFSTLHFPLPENPLDATYRKTIGAPMVAGFFEEFGKAAGVAVLFLLHRRHFDGVVSGIVIGAATGIGFNFTESVVYMSEWGGAAANFHHWGRQALGLMAAHTAFTAVAGAGIGLARQLRGRPRQLTAVGTGFLTAAGAHFCNNSVIDYLAKGSPRWLPAGEAAGILIVLPAQILLLQGPLVVLYVLLLRRGLRSQAGGLEAALGSLPPRARQAITTDEAALLLSPARRFRLKVDALRTRGSLRQRLAAHRRLVRLHAAQLDLATERWHHLRGERDPAAPDDAVLCERILALKGHPAGPHVCPSPPAPRVPQPSVPMPAPAGGKDV